MISCSDCPLLHAIKNLLLVASFCSDNGLVESVVISIFTDTETFPDLLRDIMLKTVDKNVKKGWRENSGLWSTSAGQEAVDEIIPGSFTFCAFLFVRKLRIKFQKPLLMLEETSLVKNMV